MAMTTRGARTIIGLGSLVLALAILGLAVRSTSGFPQYTFMPPIWGCDICHGEFTDHFSYQGRVFPSGGKHGMHRNPTTMNTDCNLCHLTYGDNPWTFQSAGTASTPGLGCVGCHGHDYGSEIGIRGTGLRYEHYAGGEFICLICHEWNDTEPMPENVPPPYFGSYDTRAWDPCNEAPWYGENFSLDNNGHRGLDNDGDGLYDADDPDCGSAASCPCDCESPPDGQVDVGDFLALLAQWGLVDTPCDFDGGGTGVTDFLLMLSDWGPCP
jgi:hypothetical protein